MEISGSLTRSFRARARVGVALPGDPDELERLLAQRYEEARAPWPGVALPADEFVSHVAERLPGEREGAPVGEVLDGLRLSDLYLACACARRVPAADAALEREFLSRLPGLLRRQYSKAAGATIDDACQAVREKLLLGNPPGQPHLLTYSGEGALMSWTRVIAARTLSKLMSQGAGQPPPDLDPFPPLESPADVDVEGDAIKSDLQRKFR
ncbi:MAG TPA: RNA polymerase subunit sigma-70, partial [Myxococcales bacterium]|nr:RNA polymerase subunit sigma-70 [Myxococcales bacterium]